MTTWRRTGAFAVAATSVLAVVVASTAARGPDSEASPPPLSDSELRLGWLAGLEDQWAYVSSLSPNAIKPRAGDVEIVPTDEYGERTRACFAGQGFDVEASDEYGVTTYAPPSVEDEELTALFAAAQYHCAATIVSRKNISSYLLSLQERRALYNYYVGELTPCLGGAGFEMNPPPSQVDFVNEVDDVRYWTPYLSIWNGGVNQRIQSWLTTVCPESPRWLTAKYD